MAFLLIFLSLIQDVAFAGAPQYFVTSVSYVGRNISTAPSALGKQICYGHVKSANTELVKAAIWLQPSDSNCAQAKQKYLSPELSVTFFPVEVSHGDGSLNISDYSVNNLVNDEKDLIVGQEMVQAESTHTLTHLCQFSNLKIMQKCEIKFDQNRLMVSFR